MQMAEWFEPLISASIRAIFGFHGKTKKRSNLPRAFV
jgi:hypothetical protein